MVPTFFCLQGRFWGTFPDIDWVVEKGDLGSLSLRIFFIGQGCNLLSYSGTVFLMVSPLLNQSFFFSGYLKGCFNDFV